jgi:hypothetical protein
VHNYRAKLHKGWRELFLAWFLALLVLAPRLRLLRLLLVHMGHNKECNLGWERRGCKARGCKVPGSSLGWEWRGCKVLGCKALGCRVLGCNLGWERRACKVRECQVPHQAIQATVITDLVILAATKVGGKESPRSEK